MTFTDEETKFLRSHGIARLATLGEDEQPDVVPVACEFDGAYFSVGGSGGSVLRTRKVSNVRAGRRKVALVVDDLPSFDPFVARGIRVYGVADGPVERVGMVGPGLYLRITPHVLELGHGRRAGRRNLVRDETGGPRGPRERSG